MPLIVYFVLELFNVVLCKIMFVLFCFAFHMEKTLELCIVKDFIMCLSKHYPMFNKSYFNFNYLERVSKVTINYSYSVVTFSVFVICDVTVFINYLYLIFSKEPQKSHTLNQSLSL
ncbi:unnamed protein product [Rangifer tarandus platyrhynchus]|uniref:Uncharacterized protein n=1 Tax=Rangifer tarandus platyrhynchus TaxID=3082113 RepID=A0ABN8YDT1_RANTA|nr:unnamed protein product [Rangifer tarandus platyrhynchus]